MLTIVSDHRTLTAERTEAEEDIDATVAALSAIHHAAGLAQVRPIQYPSLPANLPLILPPSTLHAGSCSTSHPLPSPRWLTLHRPSTPTLPPHSPSSHPQPQVGRYLEARATLIGTQRLLQRAMQSSCHQQAYLSFIVQAEKLDGFMRERQAAEEVFGRTSCKSRTAQRDDEAAKSMFQMKSVSSATFHACV